ncbi:hypothetical protein JXC34_06840 [Candidatus Woesearchaeota archaeon]|nr:hypothetical protein [Candidatus Woesearchaeota archaeon]
MPVQKIPMKKIRRERYTKLNIDRKWLLLGAFGFILSFFINIWPLIFLSIFCVANAILLSIDRYINAPLDVELSTFSAVLMTTVYGLNWGIAVAVLTKVAAILYNKNIRVDHFFMIGGYVVAALFANVFRGLPIIALGIIVTMITNLYVVFVSKFITMLSNYEIMMYGSSNAIFNSVLFLGFSEIFLRIMTL